MQHSTKLLWGSCYLYSVSFNHNVSCPVYSKEFWLSLFCNSLKKEYSSWIHLIRVSRECIVTLEILNRITSYVPRKVNPEVLAYQALVSPLAQ